MDSGFGHTSDVFDHDVIGPNLDDTVAQTHIGYQRDFVAPGIFPQRDRLAFLQDREESPAWPILAVACRRD